jgi:4'-phosphopantetheinyl transferase
VLLERATGSQNVRKVDFVLTPAGRPGLPVEPPFFSISHSATAALVAISRHGPIGVDIEMARKVAIAEPRRSRLIRVGRRLAGLAPSDDKSDGELLRCWVRLEAAAKALGIGVGRLLTEAGIPESRAQMSSAAPEIALRDVVVAGGYAAVAAQDLPPHVSVQPFSLDWC